MYLDILRKLKIVTADKSVRQTCWTDVCDAPDQSFFNQSRVINTKDESFFLSKVQLYAKCLKAHQERTSI